jgi:hydrogenase maturation protease
MSAQSAPVLVIGIGNVYRGDDGAGIVAVRQLKDQLPLGVGALEETGEGTSLMEAWKDASSVILIDAVRSCAPPGTIYRLDAHTEKISAKLFLCSSHAFGVAEAIDLARALNELPRHIVAYGIEVQNFEAGEVLSLPVKEAIRAAVSRVLLEVNGICNMEQA